MPRTLAYLPQPTHRRLWVFAIDPAQEMDLERARINRALLHVRWEPLEPGPVGEYLEVVDFDPASGCFYSPVELDSANLLATDGLAPAEGEPRFHQQMVYAVATSTIENFERALGRRVQWSRRREPASGEDAENDGYVQRLRIHPHGLRDANAYYTPERKALLFGYFNAHNRDPGDGLPGGLVFTSLSYDVIVHETTHAILDGLLPRLLEPTNPDVLAFHEAFADLVTILQHFTMKEIVLQEIARVRGDLSAENMLGKLAMQFGRAIGHGNALRDVLGRIDESTGEWVRHPPDPEGFARTSGPHARGAILVAALFDALVALYENHTADLLRIASGGTGILARGALHPDLVGRLAREATKIAGQLLQICIRALDYLPPVDVTFGDYVRAMITIDAELVPDDDRHYRIAIIRAFRDRGIVPRGVRTLSTESLRWSGPDPEQQAVIGRVLPPLAVLRTIANVREYERINELQTKHNGEAPHRDLADVERLEERILATYSKAVEDRDEARTRIHWGNQAERERAERDRVYDRRAEFLNQRQFANYLHAALPARARELDDEDLTRLGELTGLELTDPDVRFEIEEVRPTVRTRLDGVGVTRLLVRVSQRRLARFEMEQGSRAQGREDLHYRFRGGCTVVVDPETGRVDYCIVKRVTATTRQERQEAFLRERVVAEGLRARARYHVWRTEEDGEREPFVPSEPLRLLHGHQCREEWV